MSATDEPLDSGDRALSKMRKSIWTAVLRAVFSAEEKDAVIDMAIVTEIARREADRAYDEHAGAGGAPEAQIGAMERSSVVRWAAECADTALALTQEFQNHKLLENVDFSLCRVRALSRLTIRLPDTGECTIEGRHGLALVPRRESVNGAAMGIIGIRKEGRAEDNPDLWIAGVIQWLVEQELKPGYLVKVVQLNRGKDGKTGVDTAPFKGSAGIKDRIEAWLRDRLVEMLAKPCSDHLPFAVIQSLVKRPAGRNEPIPWDQLWAKVTAENIEDKLNVEDHPVYRCYLPAFDLTDARIPEINDDLLRGLAQSRFAPMLEGWFHE
jgi:hypothetical protein